MKILMEDRSVVYSVVRACFDAIAIKPVMVEVGVLNGDNANVLLQTMLPAKLFLVDAWSATAFSDYRRTNSHREWVDDLDKYDSYFGGPVSEQSTLDHLHDQVRQRFRNNQCIKIIREPSLEGCGTVRKELNGSLIDYAYIDASHQYESVLDDLLSYSQLLSNNGVLQLNDCCHSQEGIRQNLGVLEAAVKFSKMSDFKPVLLTNTKWSDLVMIRRGSAMQCIIDQAVLQSGLQYVEIPSSLLGAATIRSAASDNLSFVND